MYSVQIKKSVRVFAATLALSLMASGAGQALDRLDFTVTGASKGLEKDLRAASILLASQKAKKGSAQDVFTDARAEYASLLNALYAQGYYSAEIHVLIDGVEAAGIAPLDAPDAISAVKVVVVPGPAFTFSAAKVAPLAPGTQMPKGFAAGKVAESGVILEAVTTGVNGWRAQGNAKAAVASQDLTADHDKKTMAANVALNPGPVLRFGKLTIKGAEKMKLRRVSEIAGLPEGKIYSPHDLDAAASRLRRTGVFKSVTLSEDDFITKPDLLGVTATLVEQKKRRYTFGAEIGSSDGLTLTGGWLHRDLLGGGERLALDGEITNIGSGGGADYSFGIKLDRPATFTPDTTAGIALTFGKINDTYYSYIWSNSTLTLSHVFSDSLSGKAGLSYDYVKVNDSAGAFTYRALSLPLSMIWDRRDNKADATRNIYAEVEVKPFLGFGITDSGTRIKMDLRGYKAFGAERRLVMAARVQAGAVIGASLGGTPRDYLFYSGGGGTVRGQPYQSLGVNVLTDGAGATYETGGKVFLGGSIEARMKVGDALGVVGFFDVGRVDAETPFSTQGGWQSGAGLGVRYATPVGPIRLDLAAPVSGGTGDGIQVYLGLGQSF